MPALLIIDMQMEMQHRIDAGRDCVNSEAPVRVAALVEAFRNARRPIIHIRHKEPESGWPFHIDAPGFQPMPCAVERDDEPVFYKTTSSAFALTDLADHLRAAAIEKVIVVGAVAGFCVNTTVRSGSDLGFQMTVVQDAVIGFDLAGIPARTIFDVTMAHLESDFASVVAAETVLSNLGMLQIAANDT